MLVMVKAPKLSVITVRVKPLMAFDRVTEALATTKSDGSVTRPVTVPAFPADWTRDGAAGRLCGEVCPWARGAAMEMNPTRKSETTEDAEKARLKYKCMGVSPSGLPVALDEVLEHFSNPGGPEVRCRAAFFLRKRPLRGWGIAQQFGKCSGGNDRNRRGTREEGEGREAAGDDRGRANFQHSGDRSRRRGRRAVCQMDCDVGCGAKRAVRVDIGAVRMNVRDLHCAGDDHKKDADYREEEPPRTFCAKPVVAVTHISPLYRRGGDSVRQT